MVFVDLFRGSWGPSFDGGGQEEWVAETEYLGTPTKIVAKAVWHMEHDSKVKSYISKKKERSQSKMKPNM